MEPCPASRPTSGSGKPCEDVGRVAGCPRHCAGAVSGARDLWQGPAMGFLCPGVPRETGNAQKGSRRSRLARRSGCAVSAGAALKPSLALSPRLLRARYGGRPQGGVGGGVERPASPPSVCGCGPGRRAWVPMGKGSRMLARPELSLKNRAAAGWGRMEQGVGAFWAAGGLGGGTAVLVSHGPA